MALCEAEATRLSPSELDRDRREVYSETAALPRPARDCADIMGVLIDRTDHQRVLAQIDEFVRSGRPHQIVTVNVDFLNITHQDPSFGRLLNEAAIAVPDGMPLLWVSRLVGQSLPERITGTDLLCGCAELAARQGYSIFLLGAASGVADEAAAVLMARFPGLRIAGTCSPPECGDFAPEENARLRALIQAARPDMLFVALGTPKQEKWIARNLADLGVPVCIGVGGVFNFITGRIPRAPESLQRAGLEWLFRLVLEPRRLWRRYLVDDTRALVRAVRYSVRQRRLHSQAAEPAPSRGSARIMDAGDWHLASEGPVVPAQPVSLQES